MPGRQIPMRFPPRSMPVGRRWGRGDLGPEGGAELRAGWRDSCEGAFYFSPTNGRQLIATGQDFAQHSVIRRRTKRQRSGARVEGVPFGEGPTRSGTATDYGCCVMAMDAGGVTVRTL
ncbi:hypothetical protein N9B63_03650 [Akkermansiaceae bacterium]|nr:hypothetical protein [Akkermansiaceae bacterium]